MSQIYTNKLFCTFTSFEDVELLVDKIKLQYTILFNKIFILKIESTDEYCLTYNVEMGNISELPYGSIMVHRKKESNTLYTINALNCLVKSLNNGRLDKSFNVSWDNYKNSILLTRNGDLHILNTNVHKIVKL